MNERNFSADFLRFLIHAFEGVSHRRYGVKHDMTDNGQKAQQRGFLLVNCKIEA